MIRRLLQSLPAHGRQLDGIRESLHGYELDEGAAQRTAELAEQELVRHGAGAGLARKIAEGWVSVGDYLLLAPKDRRADLVAGNPPYIRYDDMPPAVLARYRDLYPTMIGRGSPNQPPCPGTCAHASARRSARVIPAPPPMPP
jgi:adenine-specific DNA-methyltransferase